MIQNARVTAFTVSTISRENQKGGKIPPPPPRLRLNVLKFELQYEWIPPQLFFCGYRVLQLRRNVEGAHDIN